MRGLFSCSHKPLVGISIHADEVCVVQIRQLKHVTNVEKFAMVDLPVGAVVEGKIKQSERVVSALAQLVNRLQLQHYPAALALPVNSVITKHIQLAIELTEEECEVEIHSQLAHYFPGIQESLCHDFVPLGALNDENQELLLISTRAEQLNEYIDVVNRSGLIVKIVDVDSYALARVIRRVCTERMIAILYAHVKEVLFIIVQGNEIIFSQSWVIESIEKLVQQIKQVIQVVSLSKQYSVVHTLVLSGVALDLASFHNELTLKIIHVDPFAHMHFSEKVYDKNPLLLSRALIGFGLALRRIRG